MDLGASLSPGEPIVLHWKITEPISGLIEFKLFDLRLAFFFPESKLMKPLALAKMSSRPEGLIAVAFHIY